MQEQHQLTNTEISDYKELFMLYDKDEDGVLSFTQLCLAFRTLGVRIQGERTFIGYRMRTNIGDRMRK